MIFLETVTIRNKPVTSTDLVLALQTQRTPQDFRTRVIK
jgi:hypothetical protein